MSIVEIKYSDLPKYQFSQKVLKQKAKIFLQKFNCNASKQKYLKSNNTIIKGI